MYIPKSRVCLLGLRIPVWDEEKAAVPFSSNLLSPRRFGKHFRVPFPCVSLFQAKGAERAVPRWELLGACPEVGITEGGDSRSQAGGLGHSPGRIPSRPAPLGAHTRQARPRSPRPAGGWAAGPAPAPDAVVAPPAAQRPVPVRALGPPALRDMSLVAEAFVTQLAGEGRGRAGPRGRAGRRAPSRGVTAAAAALNSRGLSRRGDPWGWGRGEGAVVGWGVRGAVRSPALEDGDRSLRTAPQERSRARPPGSLYGSLTPAVPGRIVSLI